KETLLNEYKTKDKANKFIDRHFGEYDTNMDPEERGFQWRDKKDMCNLNEEELTHTDQSLSEMEKLNDLVDSDDEADEKGILSAKLTASHFGGGLLRRKTPGEKDDKGNHKAKSRQQLLEELILKSKQEKDGKLNIKKEEEEMEGGDDEEGGEEEEPEEEEDSHSDLDSDQESKGGEHEEGLLQGHPADHQCIVLARKQKSNHPSLAMGNKLQLQLFPEAASKATQTALGENAHSLEEVLEVKGRAVFPRLDMIIYLKITALLFPTSDFRHHPSPTFNFEVVFVTYRGCDIRPGVLCCLTVEYLLLQDELRTEPQLPVGCTTAGHARQDLYRLSLATCLDLLKCCSSLYRELTSCSHIFQPISILLSKHRRVKMCPTALQEDHGEVLGAISGSKTSHPPLVFEKKKPIPPELLTPKIVEVLDYGKKRGNMKEEKERLNHKYQKEFKGALTEIRKDTSFLAPEKLREVMGRSVDAKRKVKELFGSLATQEGEWKALIHN
ncbi:nucleolar protein 14, partial [Salmo salar]|uniref:Nucleolar protein 14 n=1 Tax=Salmo salar TaxID=8030 RepID=A0ABM3CQ99_SALSA